MALFLDKDAEGFDVLQDEVLILRCLQPSDATTQLEKEDEDWIKWFSGGPGSIEGITKWIESNHVEWRAGGPRLNWAICDSASGEVVGNAEVNFALQGFEPGEVNISYGVFRSHRGHGFSLRAIKLILHWLSETKPQAEVAVIQIEPENVHSIAVPKKLNFIERGPFKSSDGTEMIAFSSKLRG